MSILDRKFWGVLSIPGFPLGDSPGSSNDAKYYIVIILLVLMVITYLFNFRNYFYSMIFILQQNDSNDLEERVVQLEAQMTFIEDEVEGIQTGMLAIANEVDDLEDRVTNQDDRFIRIEDDVEGGKYSYKINLYNMHKGIDSRFTIWKKTNPHRCGD